MVLMPMLGAEPAAGVADDALPPAEDFAAEDAPLCPPPDGAPADPPPPRRSMAEPLLPPAAGLQGLDRVPQGFSGPRGACSPVFGDEPCLASFLRSGVRRRSLVGE
jgi:hypothetical protein